MTGFSGIVLFIVSFYATINFFKLFSLSGRTFHFCLGTTAVFLSIIGISGHLALFFPVLNSEFIYDWSTVFAVSFVLTAAASLIRNFKPVLMRFPRLFTFVPLLLIPFYPLIMNTVVLKMWIISIYQGSAIIIGLLIYGYQTSRNGAYGYMLVGVIFFLITFLLYRLPGSVFFLESYVWVLLVASGVLIVTVGYNRIYDLEKDGLNRKREEADWFI